MSLRIVLLILTSVSLSALAQICLKLGMSGEEVQRALADGSRLRAAGTVAGSPFVFLGLLLYAVGAVVWLLVLARLDVSVAYPFVGIGFVITMLLGFLVLGEPVGALRLAGTLLVAVGVVLVART
jgi:multidrug transporter EmrE-like cation transporter